MSHSNDQSALLTAALDAMKHSHCPYSNFPVGASIIDSRGSIFKGCNIENAAFGSTICAEASAVANAIANGATQPLIAVAIITATGGTPCGNCRQILAEVAPDCKVFLATPETLGTPREISLSALIPEPFTHLP